MQRRSSYPLSHRESVEQWGVDGTDDCNSAGDVVQVPLKRVELGAWRYTTADLLYEFESSHLIVRADGGSSSEVAPPATFLIQQVTAVDLSLVNDVPDCLESKVARLVLETEEEILYTVTDTLHTDIPSSEPPSTMETSMSQMSCHRVIVIASVLEAGLLWKILLSLKHASSHPGTRGKERERGEITAAGRSTDDVDVDTPSSEPVTKGRAAFQESLPAWVGYVPWWLYSKWMRVAIQKAILLYSIFSVMWAFWQLYRHVDIIHLTLEPLIAALRVHLRFIMEVADIFFAAVTLWWMTYLSPLNILFNVFRIQMLQALLSLRSAFVALVGVFYPVWRLVGDSALFSSTKALIWALYYLMAYVGHSVARLLSVCGRPLYNFLLRFRVASIDMHQLRLTWVTNLVFYSLRAIGNGFAKLVGYNRRKRKQRRALSLSPGTPLSRASTPRRTYQSPGSPFHYYSSPSMVRERSSTHKKTPHHTI